MEEPKNSALLFSIADVCTKLSVHQNTIFNEINNGRLRPVKIGSRTLFPADELTRYVRQLKRDRLGAG